MAERNVLTKWYVVNVKARRNQIASHYVDMFRSLLENDPLVDLTRNKCASLQSMDFGPVGEDNVPSWIRIEMMTYTIINPEAFYNRRDKQDVVLNDWNSDLVANKNEVMMVFIPSIHKLAVRKSGKVSIGSVIRYLESGIEIIEPDMFDITVIKDHDVIQRILNAQSIVKLEAQISFDNPGHTGGFRGVFEGKMNDMNAKKMEIKAIGTEEVPLNVGEDGLVSAIIDLSERNGQVKAKVQEIDGNKLVTIDTNQHPAICVISSKWNEVCDKIKDLLIDRYGN